MAHTPLIDGPYPSHAWGVHQSLRQRRTRSDETRRDNKGNVASNVYVRALDYRDPFNERHTSEGFAVATAGAVCEKVGHFAGFNVVGCFIAK